MEVKLNSETHFCKADYKHDIRISGIYKGQCELDAHFVLALKNGKNLYKIWLTLLGAEQKCNILTIDTIKATPEEVATYLNIVCDKGIEYARKYNNRNGFFYQKGNWSDNEYTCYYHKDFHKEIEIEAKIDASFDAYKSGVINYKEWQSESSGAIYYCIVYDSDNHNEIDNFVVHDFDLPSYNDNDACSLNDQIVINELFAFLENSSKAYL